MSTNSLLPGRKQYEISLHGHSVIISIVGAIGGLLAKPCKCQIFSHCFRAGLDIIRGENSGEIGLVVYGPLDGRDKNFIFHFWPPFLYFISWLSRLLREKRTG